MQPGAVLWMISDQQAVQEDFTVLQQIRNDFLV
jgi:hypothetical protein